MGYVDMVPHVHGHLCNYLQSQQQFKLAVEPRGHLKTSCGTIGYATWRIVKRPEIRILLANATATNATHFCRNIKAQFESNERLRWLWPEVIPDFSKVKWTDAEIEVNRKMSYPESTVEAIGVGGTVTSRHYDLIIEDDLLAPEDGLVTADMVQKVIDWHKYATSLAVSPATVEQIIIGTRWLYDDFIAYLFNNEKWFLPSHYRSVYEDGRPIWPERFTPEVVDRILEQQGPKMFSCQYLNDPVHEDQRSFDPAWFRFYTKFPPENDRGEQKAFACVTAIDPAISQKRHGDYSAIVTVAQDPDRNRYIVDARRGRWGIDELIDQMFDVHRIWKPTRVGLETVVFQKALMWPIREAMRREGVIIPMVELRPSSRISKEARIQALHEYFANGSLWLNKLHRELIEELQGWPAIVHDDLLDALAYAMQMLVMPSKQKTETLWNPNSYEAIMRELRQRREENEGPFVWHKERGRPAPVIGHAVVPQTVEEIVDYFTAMREEGR